MKIKRRYSPKKSIREIDARKNYSGEASPYWDHVRRHQVFGDGDRMQENYIANPDTMSEQDNVFNLYEDENRSIKLQAIKESKALLSPQQREVFQLCCKDGYTLKKTARLLKVTIPTVQSYLTIIREKIKRRYIELLEEQEKL